MSTTAKDTFFSLPEIISAVIQHLPKHDLIQLSHTNRNLHAICTPFVWQSLDLKNPSLLTRLYHSSEAQKAFSTNVDYIHTITWNPDFSWYYFNAIYAFFNAEATLSPEHQTIQTDALAHALWANMQYPPPFTLVPFLPKPTTPPILPLLPLPPLQRLARLEAQLSFYKRDKSLTQLRGYDSDKHHHQILWLVRLNSSTLTHLELTELSLIENSVIRDIARSISQLHRLETLRLTTHSSKFFTRREFDAFFFSCPSSLVKCHIANALHNDWTLGSHLDPVMNQDWDYDQGPLVVRTTPLMRLKTLHVPTMPRPDLSSVLLSLLQHCPSLEQLHLPFLDKVAEGLEPIIESLAVLCPQISGLTFRFGCLGEYLMRIIEVLPEQGLKTLYCRHVHDSYPQRMKAVLLRHSTSLQRIELTHCTSVSSNVIQAVLTTCGALEVFRVHGKYLQGSVSLSFAHAIEHDWVCTNLREITIPVWITPDGRSPKYVTYNPPIRRTWTKNDLQHWEDLGRFYTQIGSLTRLEVLNLKAIGQPNPAEPDCFLSQYETCLPGLLALEDPTTNDLRIGHLSKLAALINLRELRGSFVWTNVEASARLGEREVEWFVNHLPALRSATFVSHESFRASSNQGTPSRIEGLCRLLESRRPGLQIRFFEMSEEWIVDQEGQDE